MLSTFLLAITFIGILVFFIEDENDEIYWFVYGRKLIDGLSAYLSPNVKVHAIVHPERSMSLCTVLSSVGYFVDDFDTFVDKSKNILSFVLKM